MYACIDTKRRKVAVSEEPLEGMPCFECGELLRSPSEADGYVLAVCADCVVLAGGNVLAEGRNIAVVIPKRSVKKASVQGEYVLCTLLEAEGEARGKGGGSE